MTIVQEIYQYLESGWFQKGVEIYERLYGKAEAGSYRRYIGTHYVPTEVEKQLEYLLRNYAEEHPDSNPSPNATPITESGKKIVYITKPANEEPKAILSLREKARQLHKRHDAKNAELRHAKDDQTRYAISYEIMEIIIPALDELYDKIRHFESTGETITQPVNSIKKNIIEMFKRRDTLKPRISKIKGILKKPLDDARRQELNKELLNKELELKQINEQLDV